jgi:hypothetical protein
MATNLQLPAPPSPLTRSLVPQPCSTPDCKNPKLFHRKQCSLHYNQLQKAQRQAKKEQLASTNDQLEERLASIEARLDALEGKNN